jgi:hypothetical protein
VPPTLNRVKGWLALIFLLCLSQIRFSDKQVRIPGHDKDDENPDNVAKLELGFSLFTLVVFVMFGASGK